MKRNKKKIEEQISMYAQEKRDAWQQLYQEEAISLLRVHG